MEGDKINVDIRSVLTPANEAMVESLARAVHNAWWEEKTRQGKADSHPDAIPYEQLDEEVREYDRVTARAVLRELALMFPPRDDAPTQGRDE